MIRLLRRGIEDLRRMTPGQWALAVPFLAFDALAAHWLKIDGFQLYDYPIAALVIVLMSLCILVVTDWGEFRSAWNPPPLPADYWRRYDEWQRARNAAAESTATQLAVTAIKPRKRRDPPKDTPPITQMEFRPGCEVPDPETFHPDDCCRDLMVALAVHGLRFSSPDDAGAHRAKPGEDKDAIQLQFARSRRAILVSRDRDFRDKDDAGVPHCGMVLAPAKTDADTIAAFCAKLSKELSK